MIADWDLWPLRVAVAAPGPMSAEMYVLTRQIAEFGRAMGVALYPAMRRLSRALEGFAP